MYLHRKTANGLNTEDQCIRGRLQALPAARWQWAWFCKFFKLHGVFNSPDLCTSIRNNTGVEQTQLKCEHRPLRKTPAPDPFPAMPAATVQSPQPWPRPCWPKSRTSNMQHLLSLRSPQAGQDVVTRMSVNGLCLLQLPHPGPQRGMWARAWVSEGPQQLHKSLWRGIGVHSSLPVSLMVDWQIFRLVWKLFLPPHFFPGCDFGS